MFSTSYLKIGCLLKRKKPLLTVRVGVAPNHQEGSLMGRSGQPPKKGQGLIYKITGAASSERRAREAGASPTPTMSQAAFLWVSIFSFSIEGKAAFWVCFTLSASDQAPEGGIPQGDGPLVTCSNDSGANGYPPQISIPIEIWTPLYRKLSKLNCLGHLQLTELLVHLQCSTMRA